MPITAPAQTEKYYRQILDILEELSLMAADDEENEEELDEVDQHELVLSMVEDAAERGLPEDAVERVFKAVTLYQMKVGEG